MKNKKLIIAVIAVSLLLVSGVAMAGVNDEGFIGQRGNLTQNEGRALFADSEAMAAFTSNLQVKLDEALSKLVADGILTKEQVEKINPFERGRGMNIKSVLETELTEEQCDAVKAAMAEFHDYRIQLKQEMADQGLIARGRMGKTSFSRGYKNQPTE